MTDNLTTRKSKVKKEVRKLKTIAEIAQERGFPFVAIKESYSGNTKINAEEIPIGTALVITHFESAGGYVTHYQGKRLSFRGGNEHLRRWRG